MSTVSLASPPLATLADVVDECLRDALADGKATCLWCGGRALTAVADRWTGRVVLRCPDCGSELEGVARRHVRETRS